MPAGANASLSPEEALQLHRQALVIDTQQPPVTSGIVFTPGMRAALAELVQQGRTRAEAGPVLERTLVHEIETSPEARRVYLDMWQRSGVTVACGTCSGPDRLATAFEGAVRKIANAQAIVSALDDQMLIGREAADHHDLILAGAFVKSSQGCLVNWGSGDPERSRTLLST